MSLSGGVCGKDDDGIGLRPKCGQVPTYHSDTHEQSVAVRGVHTFLLMQAAAASRNLKRDGPLCCVCCGPGPWGSLRHVGNALFLMKAYVHGKPSVKPAVKVRTLGPDNQ